MDAPRTQQDYQQGNEMRFPIFAIAAILAVSAMAGQQADPAPVADCPPCDAAPPADPAPACYQVIRQAYQVPVTTMETRYRMVRVPMAPVCPPVVQSAPQCVPADDEAFIDQDGRRNRVRIVARRNATINLSDDGAPCATGNCYQVQTTAPACQTCETGQVEGSEAKRGGLFGRLRARRATR